MPLVALTFYFRRYGEAQAAEIKIQASYIAEIPNLKARLYKNFKQSGGILNPTKIDLQVPVEMQNPFKLDIDGILRYEILLDKYVKHMPNLAVIYFWVEVQESEYNSKQKKHFYSKKRYNSEPIYIFTY
ncbi:hypothetical protein [Merismopedia glauca]|uniref:Uncharacterized protein n=1 Tax=Merismopedia glauca CCAP 1448/3 TaxID=1296344 RepID=A0A2T1BY85_9CYAN|nr:hypothetical protein [Merismopedia glauca]PSB00904.1 hypothetical protein C7B64_21035 [Merismopedia glauca CCAP 1448/3]